MISRIIAFSPIVHGDSRVSQEEQRIQKTDLISYRYFYTRLYKYIYICMYTCMYTYICMYTPITSILRSFKIHRIKDS